MGFGGTMTLEDALRRFETVMVATWPEAFSQLLPGATDEELQPLRDAVAPYLLPAQVEQLYRWRAGGDSGVFGGWRMRSIPDLLRWYAFTEELDEPRVWLPVFENQMLNAITLDFPGEPASDPSVWYGSTHDEPIQRMFDSIETLVEVVCDAADDGVLEELGIGSLVLDEVESVSDRAWTDYRLRRCPTAWRYPDPPDGTELSRFPEHRWPRPWLLSIGVTDESQQPRGATHSIAELLGAAASGPVTGTIRGLVQSGAGWDMVLRDGTGEIAVHLDPRRVPLPPELDGEVEVDAVLETADPFARFAGADPRVLAARHAEKPFLPMATGTAARKV